MELLGITFDFYDKKTCGMLPDLCLELDERYDELEDNEKLLSYWERGVENILSQTNKVIHGTIDGKSIIYSADKEAIEIISNEFADLELQAIHYKELTDYEEECFTNNYLA